MAEPCRKSTKDELTLGRRLLGGRTCWACAGLRRGSPSGCSEIAPKPADLGFLSRSMRSPTGQQRPPRPRPRQPLLGRAGGYTKRATRSAGPRKVQAPDCKEHVSGMFRQKITQTGYCAPRLAHRYSCYRSVDATYRTRSTHGSPSGPRRTAPQGASEPTTDRPNRGRQTHHPNRGARRTTYRGQDVPKGPVPGS